MPKSILFFPKRTTYIVKTIGGITFKMLPTFYSKTKFPSKGRASKGLVSNTREKAISKCQIVLTLNPMSSNILP